ncbi:MAG: hypothetical protein AAFX57_00350 [Bacteroidota bacterium]
MISLKNILTISKYESKVLWRNWFFRIVSLIGIFFVFIFNLGVFSEVDTPRWFVLSNSWTQPYATMMLISIAQVAAVIFLATGLVKKDKKLDTNEVFFVRPISNLDYVLGKALALFKLFFWLNLVLLVIPVIINLTNPYSDFNPLAFVFYPLITSMPSIVFTTGVAFLLVTLLRNQPMSIVLLIGLSGVEIIYYFDKLSNILDFPAFRLSMFTSEIAGFVDLEVALWQRAFYLTLGIAFLFLTAFFLDRLTSHRMVKIATGGIGMLFLGLAAYLMLNLWDLRQAPIDLRQQMVAVNGEWADQPNIDVLSNHLQVTLAGNQLEATAELKVKNNSGRPLEKLYFTLNPGLKVSELALNNQQIDFERNLQILSLEASLGSGDEAELSLNYRGEIWESVAHLEVDQERYEAPNNYFMFSLQKKHAFLQSDYALLTKDVMWYPDTQVGYSKESPTKERTVFIDFELDVSVNKGQMAISQGTSQVQDNLYQFRPEYPLPQLSLAVGNYQKKEIVVDSISYQIYHYPKNTYFQEQLDQIADTLSYLITDISNEYEDGQKLKYPFKRLQFVETPVQFSAYNKIHESQQAYLQPETVYWPEEGGDIREFDFRRSMRDMNRQAREENLTLTDKQKQANVFNNLVKKVFTKQIGDRWTFDGRDEDDPDFSLFPNFYSFNAGIVSKEWNLLNQSIATYLRNDQQPQNDFSRNVNGISFTEECNQLMHETSITDILTQETDFNKIQKSVTLKGKYLFSYIGQLVGEETLKAFLFNWVNNHQHQLTSYHEFKEAFSSQFGLQLDPIIRQVYSDTQQPAFQILDFQKYEILDGDRKRYQIVLTVSNMGENNGVVEIKFDTDDKSDQNAFWRRRVNEEVKKEEPGYLSVIREGDTKEISFVMDKKPQKVTVNTLISRNIPSVINIPTGIFKERKAQSVFQGERLVSELPVRPENEVVVDNEDTTSFSTFSPVKATYLRAYLDSRNPTDTKYYGNWFRSYSKWLATTGSNFYGQVIRSAHFTRAGKGEKIAIWTPKFEEEGFYDIYIYLKGKNQDQYRGNDNRSYKYHYIINHGDGKDEITYDLAKAETGWNYLGSYFFKTSGGNVQLTDECELPTVYADAIKWVKQ